MINGLQEAQVLWEKGEHIQAIKSLRQANPSMSLLDARCLLDADYAARYNPNPNCWYCKQLRAELIVLGHPCAPGEPLIEKLRNMAAEIKGLRQIVQESLNVMREAVK